MGRVRFIHTSDVHLDTSFAGSGFPSHLGDRKREAIRATFRSILEDALRRPVDLVLIAGDLFEHDRVSPDTVEFLKQQFENLGSIPVFIAPGNHDPYIPGSPYHDEAWPANVHIFRDEDFRSVELPHLGVRVTGFGFNRTHLGDRYFSRLPSLPADGINLVVAHGSDTSHVPEGKARHGPLSIEEIAGKNVHYCALGHYHQQRQLANHLDSTQVWYCGIPEGRGWDESGICAYLLGEIEGQQVSVQGVACGQIPLQSFTIDCDGLSTREQVLDAIREHRGAAFDPKTILRVRLAGSPDPRLDLSTSELGERLADEVLFVQWDDRTIPALDFETLAQANTLCGRFVRNLNQRLASASDMEREHLERTRLYGVQALLGREVRLR
jgi:exonuclease SbcD